LLDPFVVYLRERVTAYPGLTARRLWRELRERGYTGGYTAVTDVLRDLRGGIREDNDGDQRTLAAVDGFRATPGNQREGLKARITGQMTE
jgi:hypothetical protein